MPLLLGGGCCGGARPLIGAGGTGTPAGGALAATGAPVTAGGEGGRGGWAARGGAAFAVGGMLGAAKLMPVPGSAAAATPWCATFITRLQISAGSPPPVALRVGEESSL